ncbi:GDP-mannose-dependent alpha-mannosyltransferase [Terrabacter tumescens]|uniref:D-inositol 3-phosphate glycosyltransferase n=1 Tax=Terrabacter tumescens TaxID=60443 RepID=A0ABQ2IHM8_9MICO|nr:GDP-mannose-dependent alpha-mannosyltransferase [Terrabacter tumescens]
MAGPGAGHEDVTDAAPHTPRDVARPGVRPGTVGAVRVAIVTESFLPAVNGVTTSVCRTVEELHRRGDEVVVIAPRTRADGPASFDGARVHRVTSVPVRQFDVGLPTPELERVLGDFAPDVVHVASPFVLGARGLSAARRLDLPTVAVFQTDMAAYVRQHTPGPAGAAAAAATWRWLRRLHSWADLTLAPSSSALADLRDQGVPGIASWGRGVDASLFNPSWRLDALTRALRHELAPGGELLLGFVGRLAPEKEVERLAELADLPGTRIVVVGDGPSRAPVGAALAEAVASSATRPNRPPAFLGPRHGDDLARAYACLDVFVHTGTAETFGQTLQEAGATGLPVVAPRRGGPVDLVTDGDNGYLFDPDRAGDLRAQVCRVLASPGHRAALGRRGRLRVRERSWSRVVEDLVAHYGRVIRDRGADRAA